MQQSLRPGYLNCLAVADPLKGQICRECDFLCRCNRVKLLCKRIVKQCSFLRCGISLRRKVNRGSYNIFDANAGIELLQLNQALYEKKRSGNEYERKRQFPDYERAAHTGGSGCRTANRLLQRAGKISR